MEELIKGRKISFKTEYKNILLLDFVVWVKKETDEDGFEMSVLSNFCLFAKARTFSRKGKEIHDFLHSPEYKSLSDEEKADIEGKKEKFLRTAQEKIDYDNLYPFDTF